jgi:hypothetical protein
MTAPKGRPPIPPQLVRDVYTARLPAWLIAWLRGRPESSGQLIESALVKAHKLKPPKGE